MKSDIAFLSLGALESAQRAGKAAGLQKDDGIFGALCGAGSSGSARAARALIGRTSMTFCAARAPPAALFLPRRTRNDNAVI